MGKYEDIDDDFDVVENDDNVVVDSSPLTNTSYTERRRKTEDKLEMLRLKREFGIDDDFSLFQ